MKTGPWMAALALTATLALGGCRLLGPLPEATDLEDRLAMMPRQGLDLEAPVTIRWNRHQVPYILAASDRDGAYALGLVHAHLRLGQLEMLRRIVQGRIAEMAGPPAAEFDAAIRAVGFYRAAGASVAAMPPETRTWVDRFVAGINDYKGLIETQPYEVRALLLDETDTPWVPEDVVAIGRLGSIDVSWFDWLRLLPSRTEETWPEILAAALAPAFEDPVSFGGEAVEARLDRPKDEGALTPAGRRLAGWLEALKQRGSNSMVVGGGKAAGGAAMIASDPHLGFVLPNIWLMAGLKTPDLSVVGLMGPGLPIFALGRTPDIAWGGTNLHAASSDLVDVSGLDPAQLTTERHEIGVRAWKGRTAENRLTPYGPVITDVEVVREGLGLEKDDDAVWALRWTGHLPSDEITSLLKILKARDFEAFRAAFGGFALPGQNMLYADARGGIGHILAARVPARRNERPGDLVIAPAQADRDWARLLDATALPYAQDPGTGFLASSNNRPTRSDVPVGFFYGQPDRFLRARQLLGAAEDMTIRDLMAVQRDVTSAAALRLRDRLVVRLDPMLSGLEGERARAWRALKDWDGRYERDAQAPVLFEAFLVTLGEGLLPDAQDLSDRVTSDTNRYKKRLETAITAADDVALLAAARPALGAAVEAAEDFPTWGAMHRLALQHPLALVPVVGSRFPVIDVPTGGSSETLLKTSHAPTDERHLAGYGSQARHVSDLADPDANYFLLAGGQDGWLNSSTFADQVPLWQDGQYIRMPLTPEAIKVEFPIVTELTP
ncbi:MAG: penicillin acylase family protein [Alphaproteobacteria bacterium]